MDTAKKKILAITGTRAECGLLKTVFRAIQNSSKLDLGLLVTGMHTLKKYGHTLKELEEDKQPIVCVVPVGEQDNMLAAFSKEVLGISEFCLKKRPDLILVSGDRDESFAGAIVGGHLKIPVAHIHGGDITGSVVDEYIRHSTTHFSHLHFTASRKSQKRVLLLGEEKWRVFYVGSPCVDEARNLNYQSREKFAITLGLDAKKDWFLISQHPVSIDDTPIGEQIQGIFVAASLLNGEKIVTYPNSDAGSDIVIREIERFRDRKDFHIFPNLKRESYLHLLKYAKVMLGNSSSGIIEAGLFKLPVINIGNRQSGRECGNNVIHAGYSKDEIAKKLRLAVSDKFKKICARVKNHYGNGIAGEKIAKIIEKQIYNQKLFNKKFTHANI